MDGYTRPGHTGDFLPVHNKFPTFPGNERDSRVVEKHPQHGVSAGLRRFRQHQAQFVDPRWKRGVEKQLNMISNMILDSKGNKIKLPF